MILLINKKRGLGEGKVNGPGGKIERGESAREAAVRETVEEVGLEPLSPVSVATLSFVFRDGYTLRCEVFRATDYRGTETETDEARPFWCALSQIPYDLMWADDRHWLPRVLRGQTVAGWFTFDNDTMLSCRLVDRLTGEPIDCYISS